MAIIFDAPQSPPSIARPYHRLTDRPSPAVYSEYYYQVGGKIHRREDIIRSNIPGVFFPIGLRGGRPIGNFVYSASAANQNLFTKAGSPTEAGDYTFTINSGVVISSSSTGTAALVTGSFPAGSIVHLINNGSIYGKGGKGGAGSASTNGSPGAAGGDALSLGFNITITNGSGQIFGGGGGGGGGAGIGVGFPITSYGGGGGGSGAGTSATTGGAGGNGTGGDGGTGGTGTGTTAGSAGARSGTTPNRSGAGGAGGGSGAAGSNGANNETGTQTGGSGGAAGKAIDKNGYSTTYISGNDSTHVKGVQT